jgi:hypothetical protein
MSKDNLFVSKENLVFCFDLEREEWNKTIIAELNVALCIAQQICTGTAIRAWSYGDSLCKLV